MGAYLLYLKQCRKIMCFFGIVGSIGLGYQLELVGCTKNVNERSAIF